jgi:hypothetical protein
VPGVVVDRGARPVFPDRRLDQLLGCITFLTFLGEPNFRRDVRAGLGCARTRVKTGAQLLWYVGSAVSHETAAIPRPSVGAPSPASGSTRSRMFSRLNLRPAGFWIAREGFRHDGVDLVPPGPIAPNVHGRPATRSPGRSHADGHQQSRHACSRIQIQGWRVGAVSSPRPDVPVPIISARAVLDYCVAMWAGHWPPKTVRATASRVN